MGEDRKGVLMTLRGSIWASNTWKQELVITEDGVEGEVISGLKRIQMTLPFDRIAQVNLIHGIFRTDIEVINKGGSGNLVVKALSKDEATRAQQLIESRMRASISQPTISQSSPSVADELLKLARIKEQGLISEADFIELKTKLLK